MIFQALQSELFRFTFYFLKSKIQKLPRFTLFIDLKNWRSFNGHFFVQPLILILIAMNSPYWVEFQSGSRKKGCRMLNLKDGQSTATVKMANNNLVADQTVDLTVSNLVEYVKDNTGGGHPLIKQKLCVKESRHVHRYAWKLLNKTPQ